MKSEFKTIIQVGESYLGYGLSEKIPSNILLKKYNKLAVGVCVVGAGFIVKNKKVKDHLIAIGFGVTLNGIFDAFGLDKY